MAAERPNYGRTGLLESGRGGLPVSQPRIATVAPGALRWRPTLLTAPQMLLNHCNGGKPLDGSLVAVLRLGSIVELLSAPLGLRDGERAVLVSRLLEWHRTTYRSRAGAAVFCAAPGLSWFLPEYKVIIVKDGQSIGSIADVSRQAVTLLGKEPRLNDVRLDHPSCSAQHAALEVGFVLAPPVEAELQEEVGRELASRGLIHAASSSASAIGPAGGTQQQQQQQREQEQRQRTISLLGSEAALSGLFAWLWGRLLQYQREEWEAAEGDGGGGAGASAWAEGEDDGYCPHGATTFWTLELLLRDLGSTNGTRVNGSPVPPTPTTTALIEGDVITFGLSSRKYVVMRMESA